ncbi:MAG: hypothetical protein O2807_12790, partial [bacterium]|nr:hypothetical protein [bacterium]
MRRESSPPEATRARAGRLPGIGGEEKLGLIDPVRLEADGALICFDEALRVGAAGEAGLEEGARDAEFREAFSHSAVELAGALLPRFRERKGAIGDRIPQACHLPAKA